MPQVLHLTRYGNLVDFQDRDTDMFTGLVKEFDVKDPMSWRINQVWVASALLRTHLSLAEKVTSIPGVNRCEELVFWTNKSCDDGAVLALV